MNRGGYAVAFLILLSFRAICRADQCSVVLTSQGISNGDVLNISSAGLTSAEISGAVNYWSSRCSTYGTHFPSMTVGGSGGIPIQVITYSGTSTSASGSCGLTTKSLDAPGLTLRSAKIEIWSKQGNGVICNKTDTLAHEIGHLLGLKDVSQAACSGRIMGERAENGTRSVGASDCGIADERWRTTPENSPNDRPPRCRDH